MLHDREIVVAHRLASVSLRALGRLLEVPVDHAVEAVERVTGGIAAAFFQNRFRLAGDEQSFHFLLSHFYSIRNLLLSLNQVEAKEFREGRDGRLV